MRFLPRLAREHSNYFLVCVALVYLHVGIALDAVLRTHAQAFQLLVDVGGGSLAPFAAVHGACAALIIAGLYFPDRHFALVRVGSAVGIFTFNIAAIAFAVAAAYDSTQSAPISYHSAIIESGLSVISIAAFREPRVNPLSRPLK